MCPTSDSNAPKVSIKEVIDKVFEMSAHDIKWFTPTFVGQAWAATEKKPFHKFSIAVPQDIPFEDLMFGDQKLLMLVIPMDLIDGALAELANEKKDGA